MIKKFLILTVLLFPQLRIYGQFYAMHIPYDKIGNMKIDGDTSDWNWMPEKYVITERNLKTNNLKTLEKRNWSCRIKVGWSDKTNKIYFNIVTIDDKITNKGWQFFNDNFQLAINGGQGTNNSKFILLWCRLDSMNNADFNIAFGPKWIIDTHSDYFVRKIATHKEGPNKYVNTIEMSLNLYNHWDSVPAKNNLCVLLPGKKVKMTLLLRDSDGNNPNEDREFTTNEGTYFWNISDNSSEFLLAPPLPAKGVSYDNINYILISNGISGHTWQ
jgi:hypothetical protein